MGLQKISFALFFLFLSALLFSSCSSSRMIRSAGKQLLNETVIETAQIGISVYDPQKGKFLYNHDGHKYFVPASNTKIPTCYAAMKYLGDSLTALLYTTVGSDSVIIAGTGSPDLLHADFKSQPALDFLKRFKHITISTQLYSDFLGKGWAWSDYKDYYMAQRSELPLYGNIATFKWHAADNVEVIPSFFRATTTLQAGSLTNGLKIDKPWDGNYFTVLAGSGKTIEIPFNPDLSTIRSLLQDTLKIKVDTGIQPLSGKLQRLRSRPLDSVLAPMMHRSDNFFAEQILLMISQERSGIMSDAQIIDTLLKTDFSKLPQQPNWVDGSGLSRYNLFTPQDFVMILDQMQKEFGMQRIKGIFATGGEGTISSYYKEDSGYIYAKTGTLSGVVCLSGFLYTAKDKLLIFSVLVNNHNGSATEVRRAVEKFVKAIRRGRR